MAAGLELSETFLEGSMAPERMDDIWASGWRHFGTLFFRYRRMWEGDTMKRIKPLRVVVGAFGMTRSQRRIWRRNLDLDWGVEPTRIGDEVRSLFERHKRRFVENAPSAIEDILGMEPERVPCRNVMVAGRKGGRLIAASFLDVGCRAVSSVYGVFEPEEGRRGLGICTMLREIQYAKDGGWLYYYPGYACHEESVYDYKKRFKGLEWYDWRGVWRRSEGMMEAGPEISL